MVDIKNLGDFARWFFDVNDKPYLILFWILGLFYVFLPPGKKKPKAVKIILRFIYFIAVGFGARFAYDTSIGLTLVQVADIILAFVVSIRLVTLLAKILWKVIKLIGKGIWLGIKYVGLGIWYAVKYIGLGFWWLIKFIGGIFVWAFGLSRKGFDTISDKQYNDKKLKSEKRLLALTVEKGFTAKIEYAFDIDNKILIGADHTFVLYYNFQNKYILPTELKEAKYSQRYGNVKYHTEKGWQKTYASIVEIVFVFQNGKMLAVDTGGYNLDQSQQVPYNQEVKKCIEDINQTLEDYQRIQDEKNMVKIKK